MQVLVVKLEFASEKWCEISCMKDCKSPFRMGTYMAPERPGDTALTFRVAHGFVL